MRLSLASRIIEISATSRFMSLKRGFLVVRDHSQELGRIDLDQVLSVIITTQGATVTSAVMNECATRNIPIIFCNSKYLPSSIAIPVHQHFDQTRRYRVQADAKSGIKNKLWQLIIYHKISNQAGLLERVSKYDGGRLFRLAKEVKSGDPSNIEAQAAKFYWKNLFGKDFRRIRPPNLAVPDGINIMLNYGYTIIRSAMLRAVLASGLHPSFGLHHKNPNNPFCLVDDLLEPYRPMIDQIVYAMVQKNITDIDPQAKRLLASVVAADVDVVGGVSAVFKNMHDFCYYIFKCLECANMMDPKTVKPAKLLSDDALEVLLKQC